LVTRVYELTKTFPSHEIYGLVNQMRRCAVSIPANIAEGAARNTSKEFVQFLHISQGSLSELDTHLEISRSLRYFADETSIEKMTVLMSDIDKMLTGLIKSLKK